MDQEEALLLAGVEPDGGLMTTVFTTPSNATVQRETSGFKYPNPKVGTTTTLPSAPGSAKKTKLSLKALPARKKKPA